MGLFSASPAKYEPRSDPAFEGENSFDEGYDPPVNVQPSTIIAQGMTFSGTLSGEGTVQVEGRLEGEVSLKGALTIATSGVIQGPVTADIVRVAGNVQGSIIAREHLFLERTGEIHGDVSTASLVIENGRLDGRSTMLSEHDLPLKEPKRYEPRITEEDPVL